MAPAGGGPSSAAGGRAALSGRSARQLAAHPWAPAGRQPFREELPPTGRRPPLAAGRRRDLLCPRFSSGLAQPATSGRELPIRAGFAPDFAPREGSCREAWTETCHRPGPARRRQRHRQPKAPAAAGRLASTLLGRAGPAREVWPRTWPYGTALAPDFAPREGSWRELWTETCHRGVQRHRAGSGIVNQRRQQQAGRLASTLLGRVSPAREVWPQSCPYGTASLPRSRRRELPWRELWTETCHRGVQRQRVQPLRQRRPGREPTRYREASISRAAGLPSTYTVTVPAPTARQRPSGSRIKAVRSSTAAMRRCPVASWTVRCAFSGDQVS